jgi:hypothetical protein
MTLKHKLIPLVTATVLLTGCGGWTWLDGSRVDSRSLESALDQCQIEEKRELLEQAEDELDRQLDLAETDLAKEEAKDAFARTERQINTEIRTCMRKRGLKPS